MLFSQSGHNCSERQLFFIFIDNFPKGTQQKLSTSYIYVLYSKYQTHEMLYQMQCIRSPTRFGKVRGLREHVKIHSLFSLTVHRDPQNHLRGSVSQLVTIADISQKMTLPSLSIKHKNLIHVPPTDGETLFLVAMFHCMFLSSYCEEF